MISSQNKELADKIGQLIRHVFNDAKMLSIFLAFIHCSIENFNREFTPYKPSKFDLEYINPVMHRQLLRTIYFLAASFRCDASMGRTQKDNEFLLLKIIDGDGREDTKFLGIGHVSEGGAKGHLSAIEDTVDFEFTLSLINHISTDGENKNVCRHNGLCKLLDDEHDALKIEKPILKSVCAAHFSALAFKDLCIEVHELHVLITKLSEVSSYFHKSARRTTELDLLGKSTKLRLLRFP